jgi:hypothetical protein
MARHFIQGRLAVTPQGSRDELLHGIVDYIRRDDGNGVRKLLSAYQEEQKQSREPELIYQRIDGRYAAPMDEVGVISPEVFGTTLLEKLTASLCGPELDALLKLQREFALSEDTLGKLASSPSGVETLAQQLTYLDRKLPNFGSERLALAYLHILTMPEQESRSLAKLTSKQHFAVAYLRSKGVSLDEGLRVTADARPLEQYLHTFDYLQERIAKLSFFATESVAPDAVAYAAYCLEFQNPLPDPVDRLMTQYESFAARESHKHNPELLERQGLSPTTIAALEPFSDDHADYASRLNLLFRLTASGVPQKIARLYVIETKDPGNLSESLFSEGGLLHRESPYVPGE